MSWGIRFWRPPRVRQLWAVQRGQLFCWIGRPFHEVVLRDAVERTDIWRSHRERLDTNSPIDNILTHWCSWHLLRRMKCSVFFPLIISRCTIRCSLIGTPCVNWLHSLRFRGVYLMRAHTIDIYSKLYLWRMRGVVLRTRTHANTHKKLKRHVRSWSRRRSTIWRHLLLAGDRSHVVMSMQVLARCLACCFCTSRSSAMACGGATAAFLIPFQSWDCNLRSRPCLWFVPSEWPRIVRRPSIRVSSSMFVASGVALGSVYFLSAGLSLTSLVGRRSHVDCHLLFL